MIITECQQLIDLSKKKSELTQYSKNLDGFQTRQKQIQEGINKIYPLIQTLKVFREQGIINEELTAIKNDLLKFVIVVEQNFKKNPEWILDNNNFKGNIFDQGIKNITNNLNRKLKNSWQNYLKQKMPTTNQEILNLLEKITSFKDTISQIKRLRELIEKIEYPQKKEEFDLIDNYVKIIREKWNSLESDEIPDSIIIFLKAASNQGATLNLLTEEVKDWIIKHGLDNSIRITLIS